MHNTPTSTRPEFMSWLPNIYPDWVRLDSLRMVAYKTLPPPAGVVINGSESPPPFGSV